MRLSERHLAGRHGLAAGRPRRAQRALLRRLSCRMAAGSVMAALVVGLTAAPALANTWTVHPGGNFSGTASLGSTIITDTVTPSSVTCNKSKITGHLTPGTGLAGHHIGTITGAYFHRLHQLLRGDRGDRRGLALVPERGRLRQPDHQRARHRHPPEPGRRCWRWSAGPQQTNDGKISFRYSNADSALKLRPALPAQV